jgi:decaprenyl-phosphate phosphoribosyltransferase
MTPNPDAQVLALPAAQPGAATKVLALVRTARPRQWTKNVLVFSVPAASGTLLLAPVLSNTLIALAAFCLVASGTYLINDAADAEADRMHPVKRNRPVAAGLVSVAEARIGGVLLLGAGLGLALAGNAPLAGVVAGYVVLTVAGGVASDLYMSRWFLIVAGGGSLFLIVGKRYAESLAGGEEAARRRSSLAAYTHDYLRGMLTTTASVTVLAYCLWAFEGSAAQEPSAWTALSAVPFVMGIMRYGLVLEQGKGEEPQDVVMGDRTLQVLGLAWVALLIVGVVG